MTKHHFLSAFKRASAFLARKILLHVMTPLTGYWQRTDLGTKYHTACQGCWIIQLLRDFRKASIQLLSWFCQGMITVAYPTMGYNPIKARQQMATSQWASKLLKMSPIELEQAAKKYLQGIQSRETDSLNFSSQPTSNIQAPPTYTVLICFHHHLDFFKSCLKSVNAACARSPETSVEILIINDDPSIDSLLLLQETSSSLKEKISLYSNTHNLGICHSANQAIARAQGEWILHLDCDDRLEPDVFITLNQTISKNPSVRFISSRAIDIDEQGNILSWRLRSEEPNDLIKNNVASHLKIIRKDLHNDLGCFNAIFEGCQDYEFALRTAINEPLCFIPDYLYQYRWHDKSQTVSHNQRQNFTAARIRQAYLLAIYWITHGTDMIEWTITGPEATSWKKRLESSSSHRTPTSNRTIFYHIDLEATLPYEEHRWKLLLVKVATMVIDRYREYRAF